MGIGLMRSCVETEDALLRVVMQEATGEGENDERRGEEERVLLALSRISVACCWTRSLAASSSHSASF